MDRPVPSTRSSRGRACQKRPTSRQGGRTPKRQAIEKEDAPPEEPPTPLAETPPARTTRTWPRPQRSQSPSPPAEAQTAPAEQRLELTQLTQKMDALIECVSSFAKVSVLAFSLFLTVDRGRRHLHQSWKPPLSLQQMFQHRKNRCRNHSRPLRQLSIPRVPPVPEPLHLMELPTQRFTRLDHRRAQSRQHYPHQQVHPGR